MQAINRSLLALALCAVCAAPAFAGEKDPPAKAKQPTATETTKASDAVSARTTQREAGRMAESPIKANATTDTTVSAQASNPGKGNWWADADIDGDGQLSAAEAKAQAGLDARFSSVDADADGFVTSDEYRSFYTSEASQGEVHAAAHSAVVTRDVWTTLDSNDDGKLSSGEVKSNGSISGAFSSMDANGDGFVTQAEYSAYAKAHMQK
jgi:hypothetical protein